MKKALKLWGIVILIAVAFLCGHASADSSGSEGSISWHLDDEDVLTISGTGTIPNELFNYMYFTSVVVKKGITGIGYRAFADCCYLSSITLPSGVKSIGNHAFQGCYNLVSVTLPSSVTSVGQYAFYQCPNLVSVTLPSGVTSVGQFAFSGCQSLVSITLPSGVTSISPYLFYGCHNLVSITLPSGATSVGPYAFYGCHNLVSITLPSGVTFIGPFAFYDCSNLRNVKATKNLKTIGRSAFWLCDSLESISILDGLTELEVDDLNDESPFSGCDNLTLYANAGSAGARTLSRAGLPFRVPGCNYMLMYRFSDDEPTRLGLYRVCEDVSAFDIPSKVTYIYGGAFRECPSLESLVVPDGVSVIANTTFKGLQNLKSVVLPESITRIGREAFSGCFRLTHITIPDKVTEIGDMAFYDSGLKEITVPENVVSIGTEAFAFCFGLEKVTVGDNISSIGIGRGAFFNTPAEGNNQMYAKIGSESARTLGKSDLAFRTQGSGCILKYIYEDDTLLDLELIDFDDNSASLIVPEGVTRIRENCLQHWNIQSITLPRSMTHINSYAFGNCKSLIEISIPDSIVSIDDYAFYYCKSLVHITLPDSISYIGDDAFAGCESLQEIFLPDSVTYIGSFVFSGCRRLRKIELGDNVESVGLQICYDCPAITDDNSWIVANRETTGAKALGKAGYPFREPGCNYSIMHIYNGDGSSYVGLGLYAIDDNVTAFSVPDFVTHIMNSAFSGRELISSVMIPDNVTSIGNYAFSNCPRLENVTIPASVSSIGNRAFYNCSGLSKICFFHRESDPVSFGSSVVDNPDQTLIYCYSNSYPYRWAINNGSVTLLDEIDLNAIQTFDLPETFDLACGYSADLVPDIFPDSHPEVFWESSDAGVISVQEGTVTALSPGTAIVTATFTTPFRTISDSVLVRAYLPAESFDLNVTEEWLFTGDTIQLRVQNVKPEGAEAHVSWGSLFPRYDMKIGKDGLVKAGFPSNYTVYAVSDNGIYRECTLHFLDAWPQIDFEPVQNIIVPNQDVQLYAVVSFESVSCTNKLVSFSSSDETIATVDQNGILHTLDEGEVTITASAVSGSGACGSIFIQVDHDWGEPVCEWSVSHDFASATWVCNHNAEHVADGYTRTIQSEILSPTDNQAGQVTYTALFYDPVYCTITDTVILPALNDMNVLRLPSQLTVIEDGAFTGLDCQAVIIPDGCRSIGAYAFSGCDNLIYIRVPKKNIRIDPYAFSDCLQAVIDYY